MWWLQIYHLACVKNDCKHISIKKQKQMIFQAISNATGLTIAVGILPI